MGAAVPQRVRRFPPRGDFRPWQRGDETPRNTFLENAPDVFARMPERVCLALSGHTHGGQVQFLGYAPIVPSRYGRRYLYGHIRERGQDLIVSGGLGCSGLPLRFGRPPEVPIIELG